MQIDAWVLMSRSSFQLQQRECTQARSRALVAGEINKSVQKQNGQKRRRGRELERGEEKEKELDGLEEGERRERGRKLLAKRTTRAFAGSRDKKGQGGLLTRRNRTRTTVYGEREDVRKRGIGRRAR